MDTLKNPMVAELGDLGQYLLFLFSDREAATTEGIGNLLNVAIANLAVETSF